MNLKKVDYKVLNDKHKESYNFQKISAVLADYGYITYRMFDDYNGADFHAVGIHGEILKIQLKGRFEILTKYLEKDIYIGFCCNGQWYLFPHDHFYYLTVNRTEGAKRNGGRSMKNIPKWLSPELEKYKI